MRCSSSASPRPTSFAGLAVLVVDDNATNRTILQETLRGWEMRPQLAASAAEALDLIQRTPGGFALGLFDGHMPGMDGFQLAARLRADHPCCPIIVLSSGDPAGTGSDAARRGSGATC